MRQRRGCTTCYLTTFSFQAPRLYRALGYQVAWEVKGFPQGIVKYEMVRPLTASHHELEERMLRNALLLIAAGAVAAVALAQQPARPPFATTKVEGTDNVYIFRNGGHQAMFIVTDEGVIATDPVAYGRPTGGQTYVDEIRKVTNKPIKYLIYSHHHYDHIAGGKAFKDAGATVVAHWKSEAAPGRHSRTRTPCCPTRRCPTAGAPSSSATRCSSSNTWASITPTRTS